jgi:hypothetical protein
MTIATLLRLSAAFILTAALTTGAATAAETGHSGGKGGKGGSNHSDSGETDGHTDGGDRAIGHKGKGKGGHIEDTIFRGKKGGAGGHDADEGDSHDGDVHDHG